MYGGKVNDIYVNNGRIIPEYCILDEPNLNARPRMEDDFFLADDFAKDGKHGFFGVLDGHGGSDIAKFVAKNLPKVFGRFHKTMKNDVTKLFSTTFMKTEAQLRMLGASDIGATCCAAYFCVENGNRVLYLGNLGDTRAVVSINGQAVRLTTDHKATEPTEIARIQKMGGVISNNRVSGKLAITRSFGDFDMKKKGLIAEPEIVRHDISPNDDYLIIASDGLWDVINDQQAIDLVRGIKDINEKAKALVEYALENETKDNITVFIGKLN